MQPIKYFFRKNLFVAVLLLWGVFAAANQQNQKTVDLSVDIYGVQTNVMPYRGYQNDLSATLYFQINDYRLIPFLRILDTHYYYQLLNDEFYTSDRRLASGGGLDYKFSENFKFRFLVENIDNKKADTHYTQESYGLIYNQFLNFNFIEMNNYIESFLIPRIDSRQMDTFLKIQFLKTFYLNQTANSSQVLYPLLQIKAKSNDNVNFGVSGQNGSVGAGYRFYFANETKDSAAFVLEAHSIFYQSEKLYGDWFQALAALQIWID